MGTQAKKLIKEITPPIILSWILRTSKKFQKLHHTVVVTITDGVLTGFKLKLDPDGPWQSEMISGTYDHELFTFIGTLALEGKVFYDIGAHLGYHTLAFAKLVGRDGHVFAFEPNAANAERCKEIVQLNPSLQNSIIILETALSDHTGTTLFLSNDDVEGGSSTGGFISEASTLWERNRYTEKIGYTPNTVTLETIDHLVNTKQILPPQFIKIDVEGAEQLVLDGAKETIATYRPVIVVEFHSIYSAYACMNTFSSHSYRSELLKQEPDGRIMIAATPVTS